VRRVGLPAAVLGAVLLLGAPEAAAFDFVLLERDVSLDLTLSTLFHYHDDNNNGPLENRLHEDDFYEDFQNRLTALLASGSWSLGLRLDHLVFIDLYPEREPGTFRNENLFRPGTTVPRDVGLAPYLFEKVWGRYADETIDATIGDFYATFGRGLALSVRKVDELGVDTTIRGARFHAALGTVELEALGGLVNPANLETSRELLIRDPDDALAGARAAVQLPAGITLGLNAVYAALYYAGGNRGDEPRVDNLLAGGDIEALGLADGLLDLFFEGSYQGRDPFGQLTAELDRVAYDAGHGYGLYGGAVLYLDPVTVTLELKDYNQLYLVDERIKLQIDPNPGGSPTLEATDLYLHAPPSFEREDQEVPQQFNVLGGRLKIDAHVEALGLDLSARYLLYWLDDRTELGAERFPQDWRIYHLLLSAELTLDRGGHLMLGGGFREEYKGRIERADRVESSLEGQLGHAELEVKLPVSGRHSLGLTVRHEEEFKSQIGRFREGDVALEYAFAPHFTLGATFDYTSHRLFVSKGRDWQPYFGGYLALRNARAGSSSSLRLFGGGRRGGQRCIGGQCRIYPPFVGLELTATIRY